MALLAEGEKGYPGPSAYVEKAQIPDAGVFTSSLPPDGRRGTMESYCPVLREIRGCRGFVINTNVLVADSGLTLDWIPKNLGSTAPPIWIPRGYLETHPLSCIIKNGEKEWIVKLRFPPSKPAGFQTQPWAI